MAGGESGDPRYAEAERDLAGRIATATGSKPGSPLPSQRRDQAGPIRPRTRRLVLAFASASAVLVAVFAWFGRDQLPADALRLRGDTPGSTTADVRAEPLADGSVRLSWPRHPQAANYRVRLLSPELSPLLVVDAIADTTLLLAATTLATLIAQTDGLLLWDLAPVVGLQPLEPSPPRLVPLAE